MTEEEKKKIHESAKLCAEFVKVANEVKGYQQTVEIPALTKRQFRKTCKVKPAVPFIVSILLSGIIVFIVYQLLPMYDDPTGYAYGKMGGNFIPILFIILCFVILLLMLERQRISAYNQYLSERAQNVRNANIGLTETVPKYNVLYKKTHDKSQCVIPDAYIHAGEYIDSLIINNRADSLKEAINVYEQDVHNELVRNELRNQTDAINDNTEEMRWQGERAAQRQRDFEDKIRSKSFWEDKKY